MKKIHFVVTVTKKKGSDTMPTYGKAAITLDELAKSKKMANIRGVIKEVAESEANVVLIVNEMLGTIREAIFIVTVLRNESYEVTWHKQGILVNLRGEQAS